MFAPAASKSSLTIFAYSGAAQGDEDGAESERGRLSSTTLAGQRAQGTAARAPMPCSLKYAMKFPGTLGGAGAAKSLTVRPHGQMSVTGSVDVCSGVREKSTWDMTSGLAVV